MDWLVVGVSGTFEANISFLLTNLAKFKSAIIAHKAVEDECARSLLLHIFFVERFLRSWNQLQCGFYCCPSCLVNWWKKKKTWRILLNGILIFLLQKNLSHSLHHYSSLPIIQFSHRDQIRSISIEWCFFLSTIRSAHQVSILHSCCIFFVPQSRNAAIEFAKRARNHRHPDIYATHARISHKGYIPMYHHSVSNISLHIECPFCQCSTAFQSMCHSVRARFPFFAWSTSLRYLIMEQFFFCCAKDANFSNDISATFKGHSRLTWKYHWMKLEPMSVEAHIQQWNMIDDYHLWNANIGLLIGIKWQLEWKECFVGFPHNSRWKWFNLLMSNRRNKHRNRPVQSAASTPCAVVSWPNVMLQNTHPIHFRIWPTINIAGITRHSYIQRLARYRGSWTKQQPLTSNEWIGAILC